ncbi:MAG: flavin reductase [Bacilli bacterium]|nr:flavin reductase [Bacilli bacterium]
MFKELDVKDLSKYKDSVSLFKEDAITIVRDGDKYNPMTIGWGGIGVLWNRPCCTAYIHETRYSKELFDKEDYFVVATLSSKNIEQLRYFGTVSGRDEDKALKSGLTLVKDGEVGYFEECEIVIVCKKMGQTKMDIDSIPDGVRPWYEKDGVHSIYFGEIVKVLIKE